jgi:hypothetical protein
MPGKSRRPKLILTSEEEALLRNLCQSRTIPAREAERARILWRYHKGETIAEIIREIRVTRPSIVKCIGKALRMGVAAGLKDTFHRPKEPVITDPAKAWVVHLACTKPKDLGYAAEVWTRQALARHVKDHAVEAGHPSLSRAAKATVQRILAEQTIQPQKVKYYLERRDPAFEVKMKDVLLVYQEVHLQNQESAQTGDPKVITVAVDEKPGVQAIANTAPDLPPVPGKYATTGRDHEYKRLGTCSILAGLDLHNGHVFARVERRHRSIEFIGLLKEMDEFYPDDCTIRMVLDNHSAHLSKETQIFLATRPNRFKYVLTPTHASWLNIAETLFGKMARTFLKHIRVQSWNELRSRILLGVAEINAAPVVHRWRKFDLLAD